MNKELKKIVKLIEANGNAVVFGGKHAKVKNPAGKTIYILPTTPSGNLWRVRLLSRLRKRGIIE